MLKTNYFTALAKREANARKKLRLLALAHLKDGINKATVTRILKSQQRHCQQMGGAISLKWIVWIRK